jgi:hypothetical protein
MVVPCAASTGAVDLTIAFVLSLRVLGAGAGALLEGGMASFGGVGVLSSMGLR